jgi:group II intron reverse transcriptase/maturase
MLKGSFHFTPARLKMTPKPNKPGQYRQLLIGNPRDKIVQKALELMLLAIFEPLFSDSSLGFRPGRSVMTALDRIHMRGGHMSWAINGDITKCFDRIPHNIIMDTIKVHVSCERTLKLIERSLVVGHIDEDGKAIKATVGTPQGSILSPLFSNIVLDKLDKYMESLGDELNVGNKRKLNSTYVALENRRKYYKTRNPANARQALLDMRKLSKYNMHGDLFRRALYLRYADDFVVLMASSLERATELKEKIAIFLLDECGLELNQEKTIIVNTRDGFNFLGAFIKRRTNVSHFNSFKRADGGKITRRTTLRMGVDAPILSILNQLVDNGFARRNHLGQLFARGKQNMIHLTHFDIIRFFNSKISGLLSAYSYAGNFAAMNKVV